VRTGQPTIVTLKNPAKGEYKVVCGIICGPHHDDMEAKLVVE
jgi:heme/copper-type cytochrome/quinol oxidase subunit 2